MTSGGLTRRVAGAQLPNANPLSLRRSGGGEAPAGPPASAPMPSGPVPPGPGPFGTAPAAPGHRDGSPFGPPPAATPPAAPPRPPQQKQSADAVYSFLTSFTAGVQRGLDEARTDPPRPDGT